MLTTTTDAGDDGNGSSSLQLSSHLTVRTHKTVSLDTGGRHMPRNSPSPLELTHNMNQKWLSPSAPRPTYFPWRLKSATPEEHRVSPPTHHSSGDTCVCVHPNNRQMKWTFGTSIKHNALAQNTPFFHNREWSSLLRTHLVGLAFLPYRKIQSKPRAR